MGQALYRKYRSKSLGEIVGQEHITTTLEHALKHGKISHAYLFTGPRGVGKTSIARILAHEINDLPYTDDDTPLDIIEIDAASNRRIDEIRDLRDRVNTAPASAKYKVYIIDEVHMLTKEAFNALLKTLEEPPAHVVFILATTEAHKLPETIVSRTQRFSFRPVPIGQVVAHLQDIARKEKIAIDEAALTLIAERGEGSFRDSISLLDQAANHEGKITRDIVENMLGLAPETMLQELLSNLSAGAAEKLVKTLGKIQASGYEPAMVAAQLGEKLRTGLLDDTGQLAPAATMHLLKQLLDVPASREPKRLLELILLEALFEQPGLTPTAAKPAAKPALQETAKASKTDAPAAAAEPVEPAAKPAPAAPPKTAATARATTKVQTVDPADLWPRLLDAIKKQHNTLYGIARMARPSFEGNSLTLAFTFAFHQKRCNEAKNRTILTNTLEEISGQAYQIHCILDTEHMPEPPVLAASPVAVASPAGNDTVASISNIFGGAELLES